MRQYHEKFEMDINLTINEGKNVEFESRLSCIEDIETCVVKYTNWNWRDANIYIDES